MIQQLESDSRPSYRKYLAALFLCAFIVAGAFLLISDINQQPKAKLDALIEGTAERPYVSRRLMPLVLGVAAPLQLEEVTAIPESAQGIFTLGALLDWLALPTYYGGVLLLFLVLNYLFLVGFGLAFRWLAQRLGIPHPARLSLVALLLLLLPVFLSHGYVYDYSTLLLWTLLLLMFAEERWRWTLFIVALAAMNKETALFIPLIWLTYGRTLGRPQLYWRMLFAQSVIVVICWGMITWWYRNNGGGLFEFNLPVHLIAYQTDPVPIASVVLAILVLLVIALPMAPPLLRSSAVLLLPLAGLYLFFGWPYEFRVFYEVYPVLVMLGALAIQRISRRGLSNPSDEQAIIATEYAQRSKTSRMDTPFACSRQYPRVLMLGVLIAAWFLRVWRLHETPPGLLVEEALNGLDATAIGANWLFPQLLSTHLGGGSLFVHLQGALTNLVGTSAYSLRIAAAIVGTLTIAVLFTLTRLLLASAVIVQSSASEAGDSRQKSLMPGMLAAFGAGAIALSYWHVSLSRLGLDSVMLPPISALAGYFFWRAWSGARLENWFWAGLWTGLTLYSGPTALIFPVVPVAFVLLGGLFNPWQLHSPIVKQRIRGLSVMTVTVLFFFAPLAMQFVQSPVLAAGNIVESSVFTAPYATMPGTPRERLGQNLTGLLNAFYVNGDSDLRYNLPGLPLQSILLSVVFTVGLGVALWGIARPVYRLVMLWLIIMTLPGWLAVNAPANVSLSGIIPPLAVLYGIGAAMLIELRLPPLSRDRAVGAAFALALVVVGASTTYNYFVRWPRTSEIAEAFGQNQYRAAEYVKMQLHSKSERHFLLSESLYQTPPMRFLMPEVEDRPVQATLPLQHGGSPQLSLDGQFLLDLQSSSANDLFLMGKESGRIDVVRYAANNAAGDSLTDWLLENGRPAGAGANGTSAHQIAIGKLPERLDLMPALIPNPLSITFENGLELVGYEPLFAQGVCPLPGDSISLNTYWRRTPTYSLGSYGEFMFAHLILPENQIHDNGVLRGDYPPRFWQPGEIVRVQSTFRIDAIQAGGKSGFEIGLYRRNIGGVYERHAIFDGAGNFAGDQVNLAPFFVCADPPVVSTTDLFMMNTIFEDRIELVGMDSQLAGGDDAVLTVRLVWRAVDRMHADFVAFVHLIDQADQIISQVDQPPGGVDNQTTRWALNEMVVSRFALAMPSGIDLSLYRLRIGLYEPVSGRQLVIVAPVELQGNSYMITPVLQ